MCPPLETLFTFGLETPGQRAYCYYYKTFFGKCLDIFLAFKFFIGVFGKYAGRFPKTKMLSLQTSLLCIVGDLAGGGSVAVAVGASDR